MARVDVPITIIPATGVADPAEVNGDATNNHELAYNDGLVFVIARNAGASTRNVTIQTPGTVAGLAIADQVVQLTNAQEKLIGPFPPSIYSQSSGKVNIDVDHADVKLRAFHLG